MNSFSTGHHFCLYACSNPVAIHDREVILFERQQFDGVTVNLSIYQLLSMWLLCDKYISINIHPLLLASTYFF